MHTTSTAGGQNTLRVLTNNAARSPEASAEIWPRYGLSEFAAEHIITSGATTRHFLECKISKGKVAYLGTEQSAAYIVAAGLEAVPIRDVDLSRGPRDHRRGLSRRRGLR